MDVKIRSLLALCDSKCFLLFLMHCFFFLKNTHNFCLDNGQALDEAFEYLRNNESRPAVDGPDMFSHDLFVLCAESAIQVSFFCERRWISSFFSTTLGGLAT